MKQLKFKYNIGDRVWLKNTLEEAVVSDFVDMKMLKVQTTDGHEVPVFMEDLEIYKNQNVPDYEPEAVSSETNFSEAELYFQKYGNEMATGFYLSFLPVEEEDRVAFFEMMLINDTNDEINFEIKLFIKGEVYMHLQQWLHRRYVYRLGDLAFDELGENPTVEIKLEHRSHPLFHLEKTIKLKPKTFFKDKSSAPLINESAFNYHLGALQEISETKKAEELKITPQLGRSIEHRIASNYNRAQVKKHEHFYVPDVIDLHIENLIANHRGMTNAEIITTQLSHFKAALEAAIINKLEKFTVVHGIGKGKLRSEIEIVLRQYKAVRSFKNEYHHRYGFGATEIFLL